MGVQCCKSVVHGVKGTVHKDGVGHRASVVFGLRFIPLFAVVVPFHQEGIFGGQPGEEMSTLHGQPPFKRGSRELYVGFQVDSRYMQIGGSVSMACHEKRRTEDYQVPVLATSTTGGSLLISSFTKSITYDYHTGTTVSTCT